MANLEAALLRTVDWECMVVDEGHRLRTKESKLFQSLSSLTARQRTLLTGTPLQNNLDELFILLHFLEPTKFKDLAAFQAEFAEIGNEAQVARLHELLQPYLLRRLKKDVLKEMPPKRELIVRVELSAQQRALYKAVLTKNFAALRSLGRPGAAPPPLPLRRRGAPGPPWDGARAGGADGGGREAAAAAADALEAAGAGPPRAHLLAVHQGAGRAGRLAQRAAHSLRANRRRRQRGAAPGEPPRSALWTSLHLTLSPHQPLERTERRDFPVIRSWS